MRADTQGMALWKVALVALLAAVPVLLVLWASHADMAGAMLRCPC